MDRGLVLGIGVCAVLVPIFIGISKGQIPKEILRSWAVPLAATTFLLAAGVQFIETSLEPKTKFIASLLFSAIWGIAGIYIGFVQPRRNPNLPEQIREAMKTVGIIFVAFGLVWAGLSF